MVFNETVYLSWLASGFIPCGILKDLLLRYTSAEEIFRTYLECPASIWSAIPDSSRKALIHNASEDVLRFWKDCADRHAIKSMTVKDSGYPAVFNDLPEMPPILFYQGEPAALLSERRIAIVGSRRATREGIRATEQLSRDLSYGGVCIISGFAYGIDSAAHTGCLSGGSPTIAVAGCGLDQNYPSANNALKKQILNSGGLFITEFALGELPHGWHFPIRNRIISGLAKALVVMEARIQSGTMTTVRHALDQGRDVFVYPGLPSSAAFSGNHQLLREGAVFFTNAVHIMEDMEWLDIQAETEQNNEYADSSSGRTKTEEVILRLLSGEALGLDQLCGASGLPASEIMSAITLLQLRGTVEALPGKIYSIK